MRIRLAVPSRPGSTSGNSVTGDRWAMRLRELGHDATIVAVHDGAQDDGTLTGRLLGPMDVFVALHATRCADVIARVAADRPEVPIVVGLAGTDLYRDLPDDPAARASLDVARRLVVLQDDGISALRAIDPAFAAKASVVHQSVDRTASDRVDILDTTPTSGVTTVVVLAHLRDVKDPLLAARAARSLDPSSTVRVEHAGAAHTDAWADAAERESRTNRRYTWHGPLDRAAADRLLDRADVLACTSLLEGGANAVSEAIARGLPVVGTDIGGNRGLLGDDHPGLVPVGDARALAAVFTSFDDPRAPSPTSLEDLRARSLARRWITEPDHERSQWRHVLDLARR